MAKREIRVIIDTNLWLSFLLSPGTSRLDTVLTDPNITLLFSEELLNEFLEVSQRPKFRKYFSFEELQYLLIGIEEKAVFINVSAVVDLCRDPKDNFLLALAKDARANYLVTGDKDLLILERYGRTKIVSVSQLIQEMKRLP